jgi:hypothetical protein
MRFSLLPILALAPVAFALVLDTPTIKSRRTWDLTWRLDTEDVGFFLTRDWETFDFIGVAPAEPEKATVRVPRELLRPG